MVRYDAYRDMGGSQSWSIALIDGNQHRRGGHLACTPATTPAMYLKELVEGTPGQRLSPEEERAVALATGAPARRRPARRRPPAAGEPAGPPRPRQPTGEIPTARPTAGDA